MRIPEFISFKELINLFASKVGIGEGALEKDIIFLYNASNLDINDLRCIKQIFPDHCTVTVVDQNNVIGANNIYCS